MSPISQARINTTAIALSGEVHHQSHSMPVIPAFAIQGITRNWVSGHIRNAVTGEAIFSTDCPNPKTRHCRSIGTTFCITVCSADSIIGEKSMKKKNDIPTIQIDEIIGKRIQIIHIMRFPRRTVLTGFFPSPYLPTIIPQRMNPILVRARTVPQISTETIESP